MTLNNKEIDMLTYQKTFFKGVIEDNNDPMQIGRVRVRVLGVHSFSREDVPVDTLPWCPVLKSLDFGGFQSGMGISSVPTKGSWVFVTPESGIMDSFIVLGALSGITNTKSTDGFSDPDGKYPKSAYLGLPDMNLESVGAGYISVHTIETPGGHKIQIDDGEFIRIKHANGNEVKLDNSSIKITSVKDRSDMTTGSYNCTAQKEITIKADGTISISTAGDLNVSANGNINVSSQSNTSVNIAGNADVKVTGTANLESTGALKVKSAATVDIESGSTITLKSSSNTMVI